jgi:predicted metal-dependent enzyme (double-stranded beta helix superfamily)
LGSWNNAYLLQRQMQPQAEPVELGAKYVERWKAVGFGPDIAEPKSLASASLAEASERPRVILLPYHRSHIRSSVLAQTPALAPSVHNQVHNHNQVAVLDMYRLAFHNQVHPPHMCRIRPC